jgi:hypothetical protein
MNPHFSRRDNKDLSFSALVGVRFNKKRRNRFGRIQHVLILGRVQVVAQLVGDLPEHLLEADHRRGTIAVLRGDLLPAGRLGARFAFFGGCLLTPGHRALLTRLAIARRSIGQARPV